MASSAKSKGNPPLELNKERISTKDLNLTPTPTPTQIPIQTQIPTPTQNQKQKQKQNPNLPNQQSQNSSTKNHEINQIENSSQEDVIDLDSPIKENEDTFIQVFKAFAILKEGNLPTHAEIASKFQDIKINSIYQSVDKKSFSLTFLSETDREKF